jgi:hypothetical protein
MLPILSAPRATVTAVPALIETLRPRPDVGVVERRSRRVGLTLAQRLGTLDVAAQVAVAERLGHRPRVATA